LTEEQTVEIVAQAETLAEEQSEELPRRKGARPHPEEAVAIPAEAPAGLDGEGGGEGEFVDPADGQGPEAGADGDGMPGEEFADESAMGIDPDSPAGSSEEVESSADEGAGGEGEDLHDLALATEGSGLAPHGHEVTFPPSDDDQGETIRIVTEAVELGEDEQMGPGSPEESEAPSRPSASSPRTKRSAERTEDQSGDTP
jgi:N utilization substance protein A